MTEETPQEESKGLGDTVEKIITKIGETTKIEYIRKKKGCEGCRKRKEWLNKQFPYQNQTEASTEALKESDCPECEKKKRNCSRCNKKK